MTTWRHVMCRAALCIFPLAASAATITLNPGQNVTAAVESASDGDTIQLNPGTYNAANTSAYNVTGTFGITRRVRIVGLGTTPAAVILRGSSATDYTVKFLRYIPVINGSLGNPSGATLENLTIDSGGGGIAITDGSVRFSDITIKDVVISTRSDGPGFGVWLEGTDRIALDNVTTTSNQTGFYIRNTNDSLVMNSTVTSTGAEAAVGLAVLGGSGNTLVGNTIGSVKANPALDSGYSFKAGGVVFYNSKANRFEGNTVQGHRDDGLDFQALNLAGSLPAPQDTQQSTDNYAGKNNVVSTGFAAGRVAGSGIWVNCASNNTWLFANESRGSAECGTCVWLSRNTMMLGNKLHDNRLAGIVVSGGVETPPFCTNPAYRQKPQSVFLRNNDAYFNGNEQVVVRASDSTDISLNFFSSTNGFGGAAQACGTSGCQAAFALEGDPADASATSNGVRLMANTHAHNARGIQSDDGKVSGLEFYFNRMFNGSSTNRFVSTGVNFDAGTALGGNYWAVHTAFGNPSTSNPYSGVFHNTSNATGLVVDRFPYQTDDFGRGWAVTVFEPRAGSVAQGTRRTVRWYAPGCTYADVTLDGTTDLMTNTPNIGYAVVTIPTSATTGSHTVVVRCKDSAGAAKGQGSSPAFTVTSSTLQLKAPGRDDVFNAGQAIWVGWKKTSAIASVDIEFSSDGGTTFNTLATGQTGTTARVTLPSIASTAYGVIRVKSGTAADSTDGVFAVRGTSGAGFANVTAGRKLIMGQAERLEWASPQGSRLVTITATRGGTTKTVANNLPDRGNVDWIVDDMGVGALTLQISYKQTDGSAISSASNSSGTTAYPTTITFGSTPSIGAGQNGTVSATTNSGLAVTFTSLTTNVCTVAGSTVTGVANGSCTIAANQVGNATYAAAPQVTLIFSVGQGQTITFGAAPTVVVNGTGTVSATASSGLAVTFSTLTPSVCTVSGSTVSGLAAGTCTIAADQAGNATFSPAQRVTQNFQVVSGTSISRLANISTRGPVQTGNDVMIGGFIISGTGPKKVLISARGPSLAAFGVAGVISDPKVQLYSGQTVISTNDNWQSASNAAEVTATGLAPTNPLEAAILTTLNPGAYTAVVSGVNDITGVGIVEVFEVDRPELQLTNISTRGQVQTGDNVMIGGFIIQGAASRTVLVTARGPSLIPFGIPNAISNPKLELYSGQTLIASNDDIGTAPNLSDILATGNAPTNALESAILITLNPGAYTAKVSGVNGVTGVGIVEVFAR